MFDKKVFTVLVDRRHAGHVLHCTNAVSYEAFLNLPRLQARSPRFVYCNGVSHSGYHFLRSRSSDLLRFYSSSFTPPRKKPSYRYCIISFSFFLYLASNLETQPCDTRNCLEIWQGFIPNCANSTIFSRTNMGNGLPVEY